MRAPSSSFAALALLGLGALALTTSDTPATACSSSVVTVAETRAHPDLPLDGFVGGRLGLVRPTFARSYLVVAYRVLSGLPLDPAERRSMLELYTRRLGIVEPSKVSSSPPSPLPAGPDPAGRWGSERARVLGVAPAPVPNGYTTKAHAWVVPCNDDAFRVATDALLDREKTRPPQEVAEWVRAQDLVFANCAGPATPAIPAAASAKAPPAARADRDYQIAAANLYANRFDEAERRFRAIGADASSPWRRLSRYLVARTLARRAVLESDAIDRAQASRAIAELDRLRADPDMAPLARAIDGYRRYARPKADPAGSLVELSAQVLGPRGQDLGGWVADYTLLLDADETALTRATDDLTVWIGVMQGKRPADEALRMYHARKTTPWLVAALVTAENARDPRLDAPLAAAVAARPGAPELPTVRYHLLRLSAARRVPAATLGALVAQARADLSPSEGPSTKNAFALFAARHAPDVARFVAAAAVVPAGVEEDSGPAVFDPKARRAFPPEITEMMNAGLPMSSWVDAATASGLDADVRAHVAATAWVRAMLLGEAKTASRLAPIVSRSTPALAPYVAKVESAGSADERRLALVYALLKAPSLGPDVDPWTTGGGGPDAIDTSYGGYFWCSSAPPPGAAPPPALALVGPAERAAAERERAALAKLGAGATWLASEAARLADAVPSDPRVPEALHLAVRGGRYACKDAGTQAASKRAFQVLHKKYPKSPWTAKTPYYY